MPQPEHHCPLCGAPLSAPPCAILPERGMVVANGAFAFVPTSEMALLTRLVEIFPRPLSRDAAMQHLYALRPDEEPQPKIVDVFICKLRKKIEPLGIRIDTLWGRGYVLRVDGKPQIVREAA